MEEIAFFSCVPPQLCPSCSDVLQLLNIHLGQGKDLSAAGEGGSSLYLETHCGGSGHSCAKVTLMLSGLAAVYT